MSNETAKELLDSELFAGRPRVYLLVTKPGPGVHDVTASARVVVGEGFALDHKLKAYYRGQVVPGREVSAVTAEFCAVVGLDPAAVGDNVVTQGIDLRDLAEGDRLRFGEEVVLVRSSVPHRPCKLFEQRAGSVAYQIARDENWRGALFNVAKGGTVRVGDEIRVERRKAGLPVIEGEQRVGR